MEHFKTLKSGQNFSCASNEQGILTGPVPLLPNTHHILTRPATKRHIDNIGFLWETQQPIDYQIMMQSLAFLIKHHDALRLRFIQVNDGWQAHIAEPDDLIPLDQVDLSKVDVDQQSTLIETEAERFQGSLNLAEGPLIRMVHFYLGDNQSGRLLFFIHHFICDGYSLSFLLQDIFTVYLQLSQHQSPHLPPKTTSLKYFAEYLSAHADSEIFVKEINYWTSEQRLQVTPLPVDYPEGLSSPAVRNSISFSFNETEMHPLLALRGLKISDLLLAVLFQTYANWTGEKKMLVEIINHGRTLAFPDIDLSRTAGCFVTLCPFLLSSEQVSYLREVTFSVKEQLLQVSNGGLGFGVLRFLSSNHIRQRFLSLPEPQLSFNFLGRSTFQGELAPSLIKPAKENIRGFVNQQMIDPTQMAFTAKIVGKKLEVNWKYQENLYNKVTVERLIQDFSARLRSAHCAFGI